MGALDLITRSVRSLLGVSEAAETAVARHSPLAEVDQVESKLLEAVDAVRKATESIERHVEVVETLATSLPPLTESVTRLTNQLGELLALTAPLVAAERDISRVEHFFGRRRHEGQGSSESPG